MGNISDYIDISITRETQGIQRFAYNIPLILAEVSEFYERTKQYNGIKEIADDFDSTDIVYEMASAIYAQDPSIKTIKVGRKYANVNALQRFTPVAIPSGGTFKITLGSEETAAIAYNAANTAIKSALEALTAVTAVTVTGDLTTLSGFTVEFTGADGNKHWATMSVNAASLTGCSSVAVSVVQYGSADESYTDALDAIRDYDDQWYHVMTDTIVDADLEEVAAAIQSTRKMYAARTESADVPTSSTGDIASTLSAANYTRTHLWSSQIADHKLECAIVSRQATKRPGTSVYFGKTLEGQTADTYTSSQKNYALGKNANIYLTNGGVDMTDAGKTCQGEWIDNMVGIDHMQTVMEERIFAAFVNAEKIPYTNAGVAIIAGIIQGVLNDNYLAGFITDDYAVNSPDVADIDDADKADRILPDITFSATLQNAVQKAQIRGTVSL